MIYVLWEFLCLSLLWSVFIRTVLMDKTTRLDVRISLVLMGTAALFGTAAPLYGWTPDVVTIVIVAAVSVLQNVMAQHWQTQVPRHFVNPKYLAQRRAGDTP